MNRRATIKARQRGVSLVEILIVLMIAAMVAGVVVINLPPPRSNAQDAGERFAARVTLAGEQAVTRGEMIGLRLAEDSYSFYRYNRGEWIEMDSAVAGEDSFPEGLTVDLTLADAARKNERSQTKKETEERPRPNILFSPTGETTPFEVSFAQRRSTMRVVQDSAGKVEVKKDVEPR